MAVAVMFSTVLDGATGGTSPLHREQWVTTSASETPLREPFAVLEMLTATVVSIATREAFTPEVMATASIVSGRSIGHELDAVAHRLSIVGVLKIDEADQSIVDQIMATSIPQSARKRIIKPPRPR